MLRRSRDKPVRRGSIVYLPQSRSRGGGKRGRLSGPPLRRAGASWKSVVLLAAMALLVLGGGEGLDPLGVRGWFGESASPPLRAAISVSPRRAEGRDDCRVARVIDGDTVDLHCAGDGTVRARLVGFDTPEVFSPGCASELARGSAATRALEQKINASSEVRVAFRGTDHYGRRLARLSLDGRDVAGSMIAEGLARSYDGGARRSWCG